MADTNAPTVDNNGYYLDEVSAGFEAGAKSMMEELKTAEAALKNDPSDPAVLANYQSKLQQYTLFRNAQTSTVKAYKDIGAAIIQNFR
ncbi:MULTISPECIES: type III secretion system needle filament subunit SctF [Rahnella]|jgi:type III secretion protein F|uniref:EscF/YscF/HrpA family type III secretion system needle major subunit n=1 Tax=Rahnella variigena TaxID=574964 RepID=A0ABX9PYX0_9GAMM|nr:MULTISPECIES: type III secretion system needle filament subunit SctF [Rahnella]MDH2895825.1 type III secretion system needle filament subunit SctF [Rahnella variigena]RJT55112.1 EscF/YscF/HrpA family type III secretion system needle major subunit [Rahnella variigena]RKF70261.1 EscF/YscF/HrpA family type III secretion system needle major subunit [Rahnella variigena]